MNLTPPPQGNRTRTSMSPVRRAVARLHLALLRAREDRGDVPGWVLISVMTAGLTTAVWLIADDQLTGILDRAMSSVSQP